MLIVINKIILHVLDFNSGITVFSDKELEAKNSIETFLIKHIEKAYQDQGLKNGKFYEDSCFKKWLQQYISADISFIDFSHLIAEAMASNIAKSDKLDSSDLLIADIKIDDRRQIVFFKSNNKIGFIHQITQQDDCVKNEIINHYAILPGTSQKMDEYAFIDPATNEISFIDKKYCIDGEDISVLSDCVLECSYTASPKSTIAHVMAIAQMVAGNHGKSTLTAVTNAKSFIAENAQNSEYLQPLEIGKEIFNESSIMQQEYTDAIESAGIADNLKIEPTFALRKTKIHKIKTDTGIEISIPLDYFQNADYVEFINNPDGTLSINLKNIMNMVNK